MLYSFLIIRLKSIAKNSNLKMKNIFLRIKFEYILKTKCALSLLDVTVWNQNKKADESFANG